MVKGGGKPEGRKQEKEGKDGEKDGRNEEEEDIPMPSVKRWNREEPGTPPESMPRWWQEERGMTVPTTPREDMPEWLQKALEKEEQEEEAKRRRAAKAQGRTMMEEEAVNKQEGHKESENAKDGESSGAVPDCMLLLISGGEEGDVQLLIRNRLRSRLAEPEEPPECSGDHGGCCGGSGGTEASSLSGVSGCIRGEFGETRPPVTLATLAAWDAAASATLASGDLGRLGEPKRCMCGALGRDFMPTRY